MRRRLLATSTLLVLALGLAVAGSASAQDPADDEGKGQLTSDLVITKVVEGDGPTGGYVIEFFCDQSDGKGGGGFGGSLTFDDAGPGSPESQTVTLTNTSTCSVEEVESNGAVSVTYACAFEGPPSQPPSPGDFGEGGGEGGCLDDQTVFIDGPFQTGTITVTNTFEADVAPDDDVPPPDTAPDVVDATPSFTG